MKITPAQIIDAVKAHDTARLLDLHNLLAGDHVRSACMFCDATLSYEQAAAGCLRGADGKIAESHGVCPACMATWSAIKDVQDAVESSPDKVNPIGPDLKRISNVTIDCVSGRWRARIADVKRGASTRSVSESA